MGTIPLTPLELIKYELEYEKKYRLDNYSGGFSGIESGPCCDRCALRDEHFTGRADALKALCGCRDPFQIKCKCHIPFRDVAVKSIIHKLENMLWHLERRANIK